MGVTKKMLLTSHLTVAFYKNVMRSHKSKQEREFKMVLSMNRKAIVVKSDKKKHTTHETKMHDLPMDEREREVLLFRCFLL